MLYFLLDSGSIAGICSGVVALVGAIATFIYKVRGKPWRDIFKSVVEGKSEEVKELSNVIKEQAKVAKTIIEKEIKEKESKKK